MQTSRQLTIGDVPPSSAFSRRVFLGASAVGVTTAALASCTSPPSWTSPSGSAVQRAENARRSTGRTTTVSLNAAPLQLDLAGFVASTFAYSSTPAPTIRLGAGDTLTATLSNRLAAETSIHWHGLALRNDMDGVPPLTQDAVAAGSTFTYSFIAPHPGTYWFHPHVGTQLDHGLYGALIIDDPAEPLSYDDEWVILLDDWLDGVSSTPDKVFETLRSGMGDMGDMGMFMRMGDMVMGATSDALGGDAGDVYYPHYLINGKPVDDPAVFTSAPGARVRLRVINAGGDTAFRFALGGHELTITHSDGYPVKHSVVDSVLIGMGERFDMVVTLADGVFPLVAEAEGKRDRAFAIVRTGSGSAPLPDAPVTELASRRLGLGSRLTADASVALDSVSPDREISVRMTGGMDLYDWGFNGQAFDLTQPMSSPHSLRQGERVRLTIKNETQMWHPFHLHGHTYQHANGGARKDTSVVLPKETLVVDFDADNPGRWLAHCHNLYHGEAGMMTVFAYEN